MECLKCGNKRDFIFFFNQNVKVSFISGKLSKAEKEKLSLPDIYPVICGKCESEKVVFRYKEIEKIFRAIE